MVGHHIHGMLAWVWVCLCMEVVPQSMWYTLHMVMRVAHLALLHIEHDIGNSIHGH